MKAVLLLTPDENFFVHIHMLFQSVCCASLSDATYVREVLSVYLYSTRTAQQAKVIDLYCPSLPVAATVAAVAEAVGCTTPCDTTTDHMGGVHIDK